MTATYSADPDALAMTLGVRHRSSSSNAGVANAWLLFGDADSWLAELCAWGMPLSSIRLLPLPTSSTNRKAIAVLAVPTGAPVRASRRALPYRQIADRIFIPAEAQLHPPISDEDLRTRFPSTIAVLHPATGLVCFEKHDILVASNLISVAPPDATGWNDAEPATFFEPRVRAVRPLLPESLEAFLEAAREDIGRTSPDELPSTADESIARQMGRQVKLGWFKSLQGLLSASGTASGIGKTLNAWAARRAQELREQLEAARQRELSRLMKLLEENPDEGLRYALPVPPPGARGTDQNAGTRLARREPLFNLGNLFGSRTVSLWQTPWEAQQRLQKRYHELANRELALGRHRRAAYIFAELIGDFLNAARALEEGRFFGEAAVLYRDKLKNKKAAAACLERGTLLHEAAKLYEEVGDFEKAGDLHRSLAAEDDAQRLYTAAVTTHLTRSDTLSAARVLETKLDNSERALHQLTGAWQSGRNQAEQCLRESFRLLGRTAQHAESERRIGVFRSQAERESRPAVLASILVDLATEYPVQEVRAAAQTTARVIAGYALASEAHALEHRALLEIVSRSNVEDRLLYRDTIRLRELISPKPKPAPRPAVITPAALRDSARRSSRILKLVREFELGKGSVTWRSAAAVEKGLLALGTLADAIVVARSDWEGRVQTVSIPFFGAEDFQFRMAGIDDCVIVAPLASTRRVLPAALPAFRGFAKLNIDHRIALPAGHIYGIAAADAGFQVLYRDANVSPSEPLIVDRIDISGRLMASLGPVLRVEDPIDLQSVWMLTHGDCLVITVGDQLHWFLRDVMQNPIRLPSAAAGVSGPSRHTALRVAVALDEPGSALVWPQDGEIKHFASAIAQASPAMLADGSVVAVGAGASALFQLDNRSLSHLADGPSERDAPIKTTPADAPNRAAVVYASGLVQILSID